LAGIGAKTLKASGLSQIVLACAICAGAAGCGARQTRIAKAPTTAPLKTATKAELIAKYNQIAESITSINAGVTMQWTSSSSFTGIMKQYPRVSGFILAQKPDLVRVIGEAPVIGTNIFDMVSDGKTFSIYIPSKNQFLTGSTSLDKASVTAVQNLRPQHLMQAIFWQPIPASDVVLLEQAMDNNSYDYVLTVASESGGNTGGTAGSGNWRITRKIWFERVGLSMDRIEVYGDDGQIESDIQYAQWQPFGTVQYPQKITLERPGEGYTLAITVTKLTADTTIEPSRFVLKQPPGSQLVRVGEEAGDQPH
jgi:outer membrane lipoprotein-sorting protein